jgi:hypothetical protein
VLALSIDGMKSLDEDIKVTDKVQAQDCEAPVSRKPTRGLAACRPRAASQRRLMFYVAADNKGEATFETSHGL